MRSYSGLGENRSWRKKASMTRLNARIEELLQKASYKHKIGNRCLVAMDSMYEW